MHDENVILSQEPANKWKYMSINTPGLCNSQVYPATAHEIFDSLFYWIYYDNFRAKF